LNGGGFNQIPAALGSAGIWVNYLVFELSSQDLLYFDDGFFFKFGSAHQIFHWGIDDRLG
jgi:hypothetical protein